MANSLNDNMAIYYAVMAEGSGTLPGGTPSTIPTVQQSNSGSDSNVITAPTAAQVLATVTPGAGTYMVEVNSFIGGTTVASNEINNMRLRANAVAVGRIINSVPGTAGALGTTTTKYRVVVGAGQAIDVIAVLAGTAGSIYAVTIVTSRIA